MKNIFVEKFSEKISDKKIVEKIFLKKNQERNFYREKYIIESNTIKKFSRKIFLLFTLYIRERIIKEKIFRGREI